MHAAALLLLLLGGSAVAPAAPAGPALPTSARASAPVASVTMQPPSVAGERPLKPLWVDAKIRVDGTVADLRMDPATPAPIAAALSKAVPTWRFRPAIKQGIPTPWATRITLALTAVPLEKGYALRLGRVSTSNVIAHDLDTWAPPRFPPRSQTSRKADVTVHVLWIPGKGKEPSKILSSRVAGQDGKGDAYAISARNAVLQWRVHPVVWDGIEYPPDMICTPITFRTALNESPPARDDWENGTPSPCEGMPGFVSDGDPQLLDKVEGTIL